MDLDDAKSNPYYWTAFAFANMNPDQLHCTHKFLGDLTSSQAKAVEGIIDTYFTRIRPWKPFLATFDNKEWFGEDKDVHVLVSHDSLNKFYPVLRKILDQFRADDFPEYKPHVTCPQNWKRWENEMVNYVFMCGDEILREWN